MTASARPCTCSRAISCWAKASMAAGLGSDDSWRGPGQPASTSRSSAEGAVFILGTGSTLFALGAMAKKKQDSLGRGSVPRRQQTAQVSEPVEDERHVLGSSYGLRIRRVHHEMRAIASDVVIGHPQGAQQDPGQSATKIPFEGTPRRADLDGGAHDRDRYRHHTLAVAEKEAAAVTRPAREPSASLRHLPLPGAFKRPHVHLHPA